MSRVHTTAARVGVIVAVTLMAGALMWWFESGPSRDCSKRLATNIAFDYGASAGEPTPENAVARWLGSVADADSLLGGHHLQLNDFSIRLTGDHEGEAIAFTQRVGLALSEYSGRWVVSGAGRCPTA